MDVARRVLDLVVVESVLGVRVELSVMDALFVPDTLLGVCVISKL